MKNVDFKVNFLESGFRTVIIAQSNNEVSQKIAKDFTLTNRK